MQERIRLGLTAVASPLEVGAGEAPQLLARLGAAFAAREGINLCSSRAPVTTADEAAEGGRYFAAERVDVICAIAASWFEDYLLLDLLEECPAPLIAWARPGMETGSLCGMQQLGFMLRALGRPHHLLFAAPEDDAALAEARSYALAAALRQRLRRARIGLLGHHAAGMTETAAHELALRQLFGSRIVHLDVPTFLARAAQVAPDGVAAQMEKLHAGVGQVAAAPDAVVESLQVAAALREVVQEEGLAAVAVGCYPHLMGKVCLAASLLAEEGVPVACEGDVNGALGMLILSRLCGGAVHNTDLLDPIPAGEQANVARCDIVFSHCGSGGFSLAADRTQIRLAPVRLMNQGCCCLFPARPGRVTLLNLVPTLPGYRMGVLYGEAVEAEMVFPGNPLRVRFDVALQALLGWIAQQGLGHHWMAAYGDWRAELRHLCALTGCEYLTVGDL